MQQRAVPAGEVSGQQGGEPVAAHSYPEVNPLMPSSLKTVPPWYEGTNFRHNSRLLVGVVPGAVLLLTVTGTTMLAAIFGGALMILLIRYLNHNWISMMMSVVHVLFLEVVNVYCMAPLMWRSVLNLPLYAIFHFFIAITGILWWLQEEQFRKQEPRFVIMLERVLFYLYPAVSVVMVTWICGILFGRSALPFVLLLSGVVAFSLYLVPLQSSFSKPNTPDSVGLIQHRFVVWLYTALFMIIPALAYAALSYHPSIQSFMMLGLLVSSPPFLLSLLEAQGLGVWFGFDSKLMQVIRMVSGVVVLVFVTACVSLAQPSSLLPLLLLPILLLTMTLISLADHAPSAMLTLVVGVALSVLYTAAFAELPWFITHTSSFLYLPHSVLQLLLWVVAVVGVVIMTLWSKVTPQLLGLYNGVFIVCEFILTGDSVYPLSVSMVTSIVAILTFWRLHVVGKLPLTTCLVSICLHVTKLCLLFPCTHSPSPLTTSLLPICSTFLTSYLLLRLLLFDHTSLGSGQLLVYSGLLFVGLLLSVDTFLSPIWGSLTHSLPSSASLLATVFGVVSLYVNYGLSLLNTHDTPPIISLLPPSLGVMATLLWLLQPEFSIPELVESIVVTTSSGEDYPEFFYMTAWTNLLTWLLLFTTLFTLLQLATPHFPLLTTAALSLLGVLTGFLSAISLLQSTPGTVGSLLYAAMLGLCGALCGHVYSAHNKGGIVDKILFSLLFLVYGITYSVEWITFRHHYLPGQTQLEVYRKPCTTLMAGVSLVLACVLRAKMYWRKEEPFLPLMANLCCLLFFITASLQQLHQQLEIMVLLCSLVFLLTQPDGLLRPKKPYLFVAPCLLWSLLFLYGISLASLLPYLSKVIQFSPTLYTTGRLVELVLVVLAIPGHCMFLYCLWTDTPPALSMRYMIIYVLPHGLLPQLGSTLATSILGTVGIFSFCLIIIGEHTLLGK